MKYRAEIDGLRAVAVVPVMLFHAGFEFFSGGFVGVDVFFVISGYLITTIIAEDLDNQRFSLVSFYERRARRILPALLFVSFVSLVAAWIIMNPLELRKFGNALYGVASFSSKIVFWRTQGYFEDAIEINPLIHTWSLAVEEQYYVLFPVFLLLAWRFGKHKIFWAVTFFALVSLAISEWGWRKYPVANFYLAPTRAWELFAGSLAAFIVQKRGIQANNPLSLLGIAAIALTVVAYDENIPFPSIYTLVPVLGVVLIILFAGKETLAAKVLSVRAMVVIGLISYSAYLWHQPLLAFTRLYRVELDLPAAFKILILILSLSLAYLSWKYIETPIRNRAFLTTKSVLWLSLCGLLLIGCTGYISKKTASGYEQTLAKQLSESEYVYFANLDERAFVATRLYYPLKETRTLVMGSSRAMQIGSATLGTTIQNLSVSGATVDDYIAFVGEGTVKLRPSHVYLGADPWQFNKLTRPSELLPGNSLQSYWQRRLAAGDQSQWSDQDRYFTSTRLRDATGPLWGLYSFLHADMGIQPVDGKTEAIAKRAYDGFMIYSEHLEKAKLTDDRNDFEGVLNYSMQPYRYDASAREVFVTLITWLKARGVDVTLVLSPYHPIAYKLMAT